MLRIVAEDGSGTEFASTLDQIVREGALRMLVAALEAEVEAYVAEARGERDDDDRALVVRNGKARARQVVTAAGALEVRAPRVNDRRADPETGERHRFRSSILPPYLRRSPKVVEVLPLLYLHGLSTLDFVPALAEFFGSEAGLSAGAITRLTASWTEEQAAFGKRKLTDRDYVYVWADGVVRHEAPCNRAVMKGHRLRPVAAGRRSWGQPDLGGAGKGGKQPRQRRDGPAPPDDPGPASETGRCTSAETSGGTPSSERHRLEPGGSGPGSSARSS